jgi:NADPH2:quinone reductase
MKAIEQHRFGGPEVLELHELPDPEPPPGHVRIRVAAAGVHLLDTVLREGQTGPFGVMELPAVPGREVAGVVDLLGPDVEPSWTGRHVVAHLGAASGGYAELAVGPVEALIPLGEGVDPAEAVAMVGTGRTALGILEEAAITADDVVLVTAAAGGLGTLLVQAAKAAGATVIGAAGGPAKVELVRSLGADVAVDYLSPAWGEPLAEAGVTVALDGVGGSIGRTALELVQPGGRIVLFGHSSGEHVPLDASDLFTRGIAVTAAIGPRLFARPGGIAALSRAAVARLAEGSWRPVVDRFPLADAATAHRALVERRTTGKVVLVP